MGPPQRQQPAASACVWVVSVVLLLAVLAGGVCLGLYVTLPPSEVPQWLPAAGLALVALPWAFWITTLVYRCCCSSDAAAAAAAAPAAANVVDRRSSSSSSSRASAAAATVAPMPTPSTTSLKSARSKRHANGSPTASTAVRRVRFGETTVLGEDHAVPEKDDDGSSVHSQQPSS